MLNILEKKSVGIDISDYSIEVSELKKIGGVVSVSKLGRVLLPAGTVKNGRIINKDELAKYLKLALAQAEPSPIVSKKIIFSFPENQTFFHIFAHDSGGKKITAEGKDKIVLEEAWSNIPIAKKEMLVYYQVLREEKGKVDFLIVAASHNVTTEWQDFFKANGFEAEIFDIEALANFRSLAIETKNPVCIVDFGSDATNVYVFQKQKLIFEYTINIGGQDLTDEIAKSLKIKPEAAEVMKIEKGLSNTEDLIFPIIIKNLASIGEEIKYAFDYFVKTHAINIANIIFIGGSSQLTGLTDYFQANLNLPVSLGEAKLLAGKKLEFIGVVGAAHRGLYKNEADEPMIPLNSEDFFSDNEIEEENLATNRKNTKEDERENSDFADSREYEAKKKLRFNKILLLIIYLFGAVSVSCAFYYRHQQQVKKQAEISAEIAKVDEIVSDETKETMATTTDQKNVSNEETIASSSADKIIEGKQVIIKETELGYLNVRSGAGKNFSIVAKIKPGETYELIKEAGEWANIKISAEKDGWVSSKYISLKIN